MPELSPCIQNTTVMNCTLSHSALTPASQALHRFKVKRFWACRGQRHFYFSNFAVAPLTAGFGAVSLWLRAVHAGTTGAEWQRVHGSRGEGEDRGNKPIVLPFLAIWVQISPAFIKGAWHWQTVTAKGSCACTNMRWAARWAAPSPSRCNGEPLL